MNLFGGSFVKPFRNISRNTYVGFVWLGVARLRGFFSKLLAFSARAHSLGTKSFSEKQLRCEDSLL